MSKKYYYSISEVSQKANVKPYVLRYWEQEFKELHPKKTKGDRRLYILKDIDLILSIKKLLYEDKYSIKGAKTILKNAGNGNKFPLEVQHTLKELENGLKELIRVLNS